MKILYAIQATGNGHVSRANEIIPLLEKKCDLDILLSGTQADVGLNHFIKFKRKGLSFIFGKKGGVDLYKTMQQLRSKKFLSEIKTLPVQDYGLVINDFEPISAWACKIKNIPCIAMSHQFAVLHKNAPAVWDLFPKFSGYRDTMSMCKMPPMCKRHPHDASRAISGKKRKIYCNICRRTGQWLDIHVPLF